MKKTPRTLRKLLINTEKVRTLVRVDDVDLARVAGGDGVDSDSYRSCGSCHVMCSAA